MTNAWNGVNPVSVSDLGNDYELGVEYATNTDISITHLRIFGGNSGTIVNRRGHIWSSVGVLLSTITLPDVMIPGWTLYQLPAPLQVLAGTSFWVTYGVIDSYGFVTPGGYPVVSADGHLTALAAGFNNTPGSFPDSSSVAFYGIDFQYVLAGNAPPVVGVTASVTGFLTVSAQLSIVDEDPPTVGYVIEWGDGTNTSETGSLGPFTHTYASAGTYVILVTATDNGGLTDAGATCITVYSSGQCGPPFTWSATDVSNILSSLLTAVGTALIGSLGGAPKRSVLLPGVDVPWDECDCGQLALAVRRRYTSRSFAADASDQVVGNCENAIVVFDCALSIVRCVPITDANNRAPAPAKLAAATAVQESDAFIVWNTTYKFLLGLRDTAPRQITDFIVNDQPSLGPQGACAGTELHFKFGLYVPCGC